MKLKRNNLLRGLILSSIIVASSASSVFASTNTVDASFTKVQTIRQVSTSSDIVYTIKTPSNDTFMVRENRSGEGNNFSNYELYQKIDASKSRITFKLITEPGSSLGKLENSLGRYTTRKLENGKVEYTFYYSLFGYKPTRIININVTAN